MEFNFWQSIGNNIEWIAPTIASLLMVLAIFCQIIRSSKDTKKLIEKNKIENHRPVINATKLNSNNEKDNDFIVTREMDPVTAALYKTLIIKNIGYGVASSINLISSDGFKIDPQIKPFHLALGVNDTYELKIAFCLLKEFWNDIPIIIEYSDLYGNAYCSKVTMNMSNLSISCDTQYCSENNDNLIKTVQ